MVLVYLQNYVIQNSELDFQGSLIHLSTDLGFTVLILTWEGLNKYLLDLKFIYSPNHSKCYGLHYLAYTISTFMTHEVKSLEDGKSCY